MRMTVVDFVYNNLLWIGIILLIPVFSRLMKIVFFELFLFFKPTHKLTIRHFHEGELKDEITIDLNANEPLVRQIKRIKQGAK